MSITFANILYSFIPITHKDTCTHTTQFIPRVMHAHLQTNFWDLLPLQLEFSVCFSLLGSGLRPLVLPTPHILGDFFSPSYSSPFPITSDRDDIGVWSTVTIFNWMRLVGRRAVFRKVVSSLLWAWDIKRAWYLSSLISVVLKEDLLSVSQLLKNLRQQELRAWHCSGSGQ